MRKSILVLAGAVTLLAFETRATLITFDDTPVQTMASIQGTYAGLNWNNFYILNETFRPQTGFVPGTVSGINSAFNGNNKSSDIKSQSGSVFTFNSGYFTGAYAPAEGLEVDGYRNGVLTYSTTFSINSLQPTFVKFNWANVDDVKFVTKGNSFVVMDSLTVNESCQPVAAVPEPSTWISSAAMALFALGGLTRKLRR